MVAKPSKALEKIEEEERALKEQFDKRKKQLKAKKQDALAKQRKQARKDRTRKHIITGAIIETAMAIDPEFAQLVNSKLKPNIKDRDKKHFPELFPPESE